MLLTGLVNIPAYNGQPGRVLSEPAEDGRLTVRLSTGVELRVKAVNLSPQRSPPAMPHTAIAPSIQHSPTPAGPAIATTHTSSLSPPAALPVATHLSSDFIGIKEQCLATTWAHSRKPPADQMNRRVGLSILDTLFSADWRSTGIWWDMQSNDKKTSGQTDVKVRDPFDKGTSEYHVKRKLGGPKSKKTMDEIVKIENWKLRQLYIKCQNIIVIDFDHPSPTTIELLRMIGNRCNCIATTRKGVHMYFRTAHPKLRGAQLDGVDVRTGEGGQKSPDGPAPDIIFCPPSSYEYPGTGRANCKAEWNGKAEYRWLALPDDDVILPCPADVISFLLTQPRRATLTAAAAKAPTTVKKSTSPPPTRPPPVPPPLKLPPLFLVTKRDAGTPPVPMPAPDLSLFDYVMFVDGGCQGNPGPGSCALVTYDVKNGTATVATRYVPGPTTNNVTEHVALHGAVNTAIKRTLIIADSEMTLAQTNGIKAIESPNFLHIAMATKCIIDTAATRPDIQLTFAHMNGHNKGVDKVLNPADEQCTYTLKAKLGIDPLRALEFDLPPLTSSKRGGSTPFMKPVAPTTPFDTAAPIITLADDFLSSFWADLKQNSTIRIWFTYVGEPRVHRWSGIKTSATTIRYSTETCEKVETTWPPAENVRVHDLRVATVAGSNPNGRGKRTKTSMPAALHEIGIDETLDMFHSFSPEEWTKWCMQTPTRTTIPNECWYEWAALVKRFTIGVITAQTQEDFADRVMLWMALPKLYLDKRVKNQALKMNLMRQAAFTFSPSIAAKTVASGNAIDEDERACRLAQKHAENGFPGKACKALGRNKLCDASKPEVRESLARKHPPGDYVDPTPPIQIPPYAAANVELGIRKLPNGAAPAWSGWTKELLSAACKVDTSLYTDMGVMISKLQSCVDERLRQFVRIGKMIALNNAKSADDPEDPRPITISELLTKLQAVLAMMNTEFGLPKIQRGVCHPGGTHQACVEAQRQYDLHPHKIIATFDVKNAFNDVLRAAIRALLDKRGASATYLLAYFKYMYGTPSFIFMQAKREVEKYMSQEGVRQGDMPASLLFAAVFTDAVLAAASTGFNDSGDATTIFGTEHDMMHSLWCYLDDVTVVATVADVIALKIRLEKELRKINLGFNMQKTRILADRCTDEDIALLRHHGFIHFDLGRTRVLGTPIGHDTPCRSWVSDKVAAWQPFWEKLCHESLHPTTALTILKICGNVKFEHLSKSLAPHVLLEVAQQFDFTVQEVAMRILGIKGTQVDAHVVRAVLRLIPYAVTNGVYYSNTCKAIETGHYGKLHVAVADCITEHYEALSLPPFVGNLIHAQSDEHAALAIQPSTRISGHHYVHAMCIKCGVGAKRVPSVCTCGIDIHEEAVFRNGHLLTCVYNYGFNMTIRHHGIVFAIQRVLGLFGIHSIFNPPYYGHLIPDLYILAGRKHVIIDVNVCDSVLAGGAPDFLEKAAKVKHGHYDKLAEDETLTFFPVVINTYGGFHHSTVRFIEHMVKHVNHYQVTTLRRELKIAIQHALMEGNSKTIEAAVSRLAARQGFWS